MNFATGIGRPAKAAGSRIVSAACNTTSRYGYRMIVKAGGVSARKSTDLETRRPLKCWNHAAHVGITHNDASSFRGVKRKFGSEMNGAVRKVQNREGNVKNKTKSRHSHTAIRRSNGQTLP